jgi:uncharacterized protein (TIGR04255 family)
MNVPTASNPATPPLPSFAHPPVNEVICGITFKPIDGLLAPHLGILWERFRREYPTCKEADPLVPILESFDGEETPAVDFSVPFLPRIWFVSGDENAIVQVQRDRFLHNWRKVRPTDEYPRYSSVKTRFTQRCAEFEDFLVENQLGAIHLIQQEMTYVNHIPAGSGWDSVEHVGRIFPDFNWRLGSRFLAHPEKVNWRTTFVLPENAGRLHLTIQTAFRRPDKMPLFIVELTVRGIGKERTVRGMWQWFDMARQWIVNGFADITSAELQKNIWKRTE